MVRQFEKSEWFRYKKLRLASLKESPSSFGSTHDIESTITDTCWEKRLVDGVKSNLDIPLIALQGEFLAGMAWGKIDIDKPQVANLYQMWVSPNHRGKSIGLALLTKLKEWAIKAGAKSLRLDVTINNGSAHHLYDSFGFVKSGPLKPLREGSIIKTQSMILVL